MKKAILILGAAFILAGCNEPQGGGNDTYTTGSGSSNNAPSSRSSSITSTNTSSTLNTNQTPKSTP